MNVHKITIFLYANLREKAGTGRIELIIPDSFTVKDLKTRMKQVYPRLAPQLSNVVVLINNGQVFVDPDLIPQNADVTFLPPLGGG